VEFQVIKLLDKKKKLLNTKEKVRRDYPINFILFLLQL
jgi:hypothetical protein